ncbi:hypothetical protein ESY86_07770 [Subsaximicrobium wynnwilliamsii]|uniref:Uncharacterized protein n=1 Tax=Subsaximicrobium wynnwilliamsii TaxID=291179 RepID=A0A5C6ZK17_9FLAO|nr:DUF6168 family protein [Subsaximicrobium wynnwilliamsii]TXD83931.1 hypothetical protein ESY87_07935 [Subsaximicrobium wynnwilliamsii]TXD89671.1 hypothetical protein ESY86_07770 [Subsaximicrobium wynnwilliamsii]TXE01656.1 hypothetical protein ESY88_14835 [Subsaximicrobium wynnwilliamsii]
MINAVLKYALYFTLAFAVVYTFQKIVMRDNPEAMRYDYLSVNAFFALTSYVICVLFDVLSGKKILKQQLGYAYLPTLFVKVGLFYLLFKNSIFELANLTLIERLNLLIPLFLFLILEVILMARILAKNNN